MQIRGNSDKCIQIAGFYLRLNYRAVCKQNSAGDIYRMVEPVNGGLFNGSHSVANTFTISGSK